MMLNNKLKAIKSVFREKQEYDIRTSMEAYKIWAESYDYEKDNLILHYDEIIVNKMLEGINLSGKTILDFGSGTGRNRNKLMKHIPGRIIGCDISPEMTSKLRSKFPEAETYLIRNEKLDFLQDKECDLIISTLVISHIENINTLTAEWNRVMKEYGDIIITDQHPEMFIKGGARTFKYDGNTYKVENFIHEINRIEEIFCKIGFRKLCLIEEIVDEKVKPFYIKKNALHIYERFQGVPFIYGLHLRR